MKISFVVDLSESGKRLDKFLAEQIPSKSRTKIQEAIVETCVSIDGVSVSDPSLKLKSGQEVLFCYDEIPQQVCDLKPEKVDFKIVFEDNDIIVLEKPAGIVVHPGNGNWAGTLVNGLLEYSKDLSSGGDVLRPGIVHRIDKDTSGILVVAKNDFAHMKLAEQFEVHSIIRKYICFVYGYPKTNFPFVNSLNDGRFLIETQIGRDPVNRKKMKILKLGGKRAVTIFKILKTFSDAKGNCFASKVECELKTGRTHQVRVHMTGLTAPLIGDQTYGRRKKLPIEDSAFAYEFPRQALHAAFLSFDHPRSGEKMSFHSELPADMLALEEKLS